MPARSSQIVFRKAAKALSRANTRAAALAQESRRLQQQLETIKPTMPRKRVQIDPNEQFANIENIVEAIHQSEAEQASRRSRKEAKAAEKAAIAAAIAAHKSMST
jgi:hypothetical protein